MNFGTKMKLKTKLKRLEEELERYDYILEHEHDAMTMDPYLMADRAACIRDIANIKRLMKE